MAVYSEHETKGKRYEKVCQKVLTNISALISNMNQKFLSVYQATLACRKFILDN